MIYKNAFVYKIYNSNSNGVYFGSTTRDIYNRFAQHLNSYNRFKVKGGNYVSSYELLKDNMAVVTMVETLTNVTKQELLICESNYIKNNVCINKNIPYRSYDFKLQYAKDYHKHHFDTINTRKNEKITCNVCNCAVSRTNITHHYKSKKHRNNI